MSHKYWQAKIWGLLQNPVLQALFSPPNNLCQQLACMHDWQPTPAIQQAPHIAAASDRAALSYLPNTIDGEDGLDITHLLSGAKIPKLQFQHPQTQGDTFIPEQIRNEEEDLQKVFWWLWRCLPNKVEQEWGHQFHLLPADNRLPDASIWSHTSITAALSGALAGYGEEESDRPYLLSVTFSPVQEVIKASRKMRDFWAGSWILHYLSAKVAWKLAKKYGPDTLLYPSLYSQPLIDHWLQQQYAASADFTEWLPENTNSRQARRLLTAGFPNVLVLVLPQGRVEKAAQCAVGTLKEEWLLLSREVFKELKTSNWMPDLQQSDSTWEGWLKAQWQTYWSAVPIGATGEALQIQGQSKIDEVWANAQNTAFSLSKDRAMFPPAGAEQQFIEAVAGEVGTTVNVGSWWAGIFDQLRLSLTSVKNARNWSLPTAFGPRSTISGLGPVVFPDACKQKKINSEELSNWVTEGETRQKWQRKAGRFDGSEELNATETVKRTLSREQTLKAVLQLQSIKITAAYPDLTSGAAGYLKYHKDNHPDEYAAHNQHFQQTCEDLYQQFHWAEGVIEDMPNKWGVPWADNRPQHYHPRLLNAGWLTEDVPDDEIQKELQVQKELQELRKKEPTATELTAKRSILNSLQGEIDTRYPNNNPTDWYAIAAGDGDGMNEWLKGKKMQPYSEYLAQNAAEGLDGAIAAALQALGNVQKRMGPSTHSALSRALLDFSNQLLPYLTEERYAGRLIYGGGDDVLAYTNLWEWDAWLWDVRQCCRGDQDPKGKFDNQGDYWRWDENKGKRPQHLPQRPLFTMGQQASISFGLVLAHHSVPLAIALENLWEAEEEAKKHQYFGLKQGELSERTHRKDAVQVRVIYGSGNILKATCKFAAFEIWRHLVDDYDLDPSLFEQAAQVLEQHSIPKEAAITFWVNGFCDRREQLNQLDELTARAFQTQLTNWMGQMWCTNADPDFALQNWLKLAAFVKRKRKIALPKAESNPNTPPTPQSAAA
ncbi:MAG: type III-B CRISPR-associated protein Cas10/Cmr2 [Spirulina sp. SIO3F2]|nr:type III-B CRISPR-associated protein Cas10/Cmr2 [Spirulina sp. SIO3F2]